MRLRSAFQILVFAASFILALLIGLYGTACTSAPKPPMTRIVECLTDPDRNVLYCDGKDLPWPAAFQYVCHRLEDHEAYLERCR